VYDDADDISNFRERLREANREGDQADIDKAQKRISDYLEGLKGRSKVSGDYTEDFEVPVGGTTEANFELPQ